MSINWKDHLVNLFVVILGISVAFWLNNWAESKKNEKLEEQYLLGLISDLEDDIAMINGLQNYSERQIKSLERIMGFITKKSDSSDMIGNDLFSVQFNLPFSPQNVAYQSLSGKIEVIKGLETRNQIIAYYNHHYVNMKLWDDSCKETIDSFIKPVVFRELNYVGPNKIDHSIFSNTELQNSMFALSFLLNQRIEFMIGFKEVATELKESLVVYKGSL